MASEFRPWAAPAEPGERIGEFQVLRLLGRGSFAHVYLAWQPAMQRTVALKVSADRGTESQTLAQLDHPNIVRVFDQRLLPEQNTKLMYMAFIAGGTLSAVIEHLRRLPGENWNGTEYLQVVEATARENGIEVAPRTSAQDRMARMKWPDLVAWVGARMAAALEYAHRRGVLHRDVKPANILLTPQGQPQLADFNIGTAALKEPQPEVFGGSLPYMSPEHLEALHPYLPQQSTQVGVPSDIYELGMTLWEMLAGWRPFADEQVGEDLDLTIDALLEARRAGVSEKALAALPAGTPLELVRILRKCLAPNPPDRYAAAGELAHDLELCQDPEALALLRPKPGGWRAWVRRAPTVWIIVIGVAPNLATALLNIHYNHRAVISTLPDAEPLFWKLVNIINPIFFGIGLSVFALAVRPVARAVKKCTRDEMIASTELMQARKRCLRLGRIAAWTCVASWVAAGVLWPILLHRLAGPLPPHAHLHFFVSLTICGLIAAVYPFFLVSLVSVRALLPALFGKYAPHPNEAAEVRRLDRALGRNLFLAAAVPLIGIGAMVTIDARDRTSMLAVTIIGLAGCVLAYVLDRRLRADLAAITRTYFGH